MPNVFSKPIDLLFDDSVVNDNRADPKTSFDRFGDDLCQLLLSYLPFKDKFRFECLSKQIQSLIFKDVTKVDIESQRLTSLIEYFHYQKRANIQKLDVILKKCPNIRIILAAEDVINEEEIFKCIVNNCNDLKEIESDFEGLTEQTIEKFCLKFGPKLKKINFVNNNLTVKTILKLCPNIEAVGYDWISLEDLFDDNRVLVNNLKSFSFYYFPEDIQRIDTFVETNKKTLKSIEMIIYDKSLTTFHMRTLFDQLLKLKELRNLGIYYYVSTDTSFADFIQNLTKNSKKLLKIDFDLRINNPSDLLKVYKCLNDWKDLKSIKIKNYCEDIPLIPITCESLKDCKQLTDLSISGNTFKLFDQFFTSIDKYFPKLKSFYSSNTEIIGQAFDPLSELKELRSLSLISMSSNRFVNDSKVFEFIQKSPKLESICFVNHGISCDFNHSEIQMIKESFDLDLNIDTLSDDVFRVSQYNSSDETSFDCLTDY